MKVIKTKLTEDIKEAIHKEFARHSFEKSGVDGLGETVSFQAMAGDTVAGVCNVLLFWGNLHIKHLLVFPEFRMQGVGRKLMQEALNYGKEQGCGFAFVETMSFQAPEFYQKLGFKVDFVRAGYSGGASFFYLKRDY